jgi:hypothetical protein
LIAEDGTGGSCAGVLADIDPVPASGPGFGDWSEAAGWRVQAAELTSSWEEAAPHIAIRLHRVLPITGPRVARER